MIKSDANSAAIASTLNSSRPTGSVGVMHRAADAEPDFAGGAGEPVVNVDPLGRYAEGCQGVTLGGEVLGVGGDPGVADQQSAHRAVSRMKPLCGNPFSRDDASWLVRAPPLGFWPSQ